MLAVCAVVLTAGPAAALIWHPEAVDRAGNVGTFTSLAMDSQFRARIAYYDATNGNLKYAVRNGSKWTISTVDSGGDVGKWCAIALDGNGNPSISYYDATNRGLKCARWTGAAWDIDTVEQDSHEDTGLYSSIAVDRLNRAHIAYYRASDSALYYAEWTGSQWATSRVDSGNVGMYTSIAIEYDGTPHISYYDLGHQELRHAWNPGTGWRDEQVDSDGNVGQFTSLALDNAENPRISYYDVSNGALRLATYNGESWSVQTVDDNGDVGAGTSVVIDGSNRTHIAYYDATNADLKYARWNGASWDIETVEATGQVGQSPSMKLDLSPLPFISYSDAGHGDLRFATPAGAWLSFSTETGYQDGVAPNKGKANSTRFRFRVIYQDAYGWGPTNPVVILTKGGVQYKVVRLRTPDPYPNFALGAELRGGLRLPAGDYKYRFRARPQSGVFAGGEPTKQRGPIHVTGAASTAVASVAAVPTKAGAEITLNLTSAATVEARVLNLAGRPVKQLVAARDYPEGTHVLLWSGQTDAGLAAPAGMYLVVVEARTEDGAQSRAVCRVRLQR